MGITDAFTQAEQCVHALNDWLSGNRAYDAAMGEYQTARDRHAMPIYEFTAQLASQEPPPPHVQQLFAAVSRNRKRAMDSRE
jgi:hypothetical protein